MASGLTAKLVGTRELLRGLERLNPDENERITSPALIESMLLSLRIAARDKIHAGGGGPPKPNILTSRTGTLRRSLGASFAIDRTGLPRSIEGGTFLIYGAVHEATRRAFLAPGLSDATRQFEDIFTKHQRRAGGLT